MLRMRSSSLVIKTPCSVDGNRQPGLPGKTRCKHSTTHKIEQVCQCQLSLSAGQSKLKCRRSTVKADTEPAAGEFGSYMPSLVGHSAA